MNVRNIIRLAKGVSLFSSPFYLPVIGLAVLFTFSYLNRMPLGYKLFVLFIAYIFAILLPVSLIKLYHRYHGWTLFELGAREQRVIPYLVSILCYFLCYYVMIFYHVPHLMGSIVVAALVVQIVCAIVNMWWKISVHMAAMGAMAGALAAFGFKFMFNPVWWLCGQFLLSGMVGSARMILRQHNLRQLYIGFIVGVLVGFFTVIFV